MNEFLKTTSMNGNGGRRRPWETGYNGAKRPLVSELLAAEQALSYEERVRKALNLKPYLDYLGDLFTDKLSGSEDESHTSSVPTQAPLVDDSKCPGITQAIHTLNVNLGENPSFSPFTREKSEQQPCESFFPTTAYSSLEMELSPDPTDNVNGHNGPESAELPPLSDLELHKYLEKPTTGLDSPADDYLMSFLGSTTSISKRKQKWDSTGSNSLCDLKDKSPSPGCSTDIPELNISKPFGSIISGDLISDDTILPVIHGSDTTVALKIKDDSNYGDFRDCMKSSTTHDKLNLNQTAREDNDEECVHGSDSKRIESMDDDDDDSLSDYMNITATSALALDTYFKFDTEDLNTATDSPISPSVSQIMPTMSIHGSLNPVEMPDSSAIEETGGTPIPSDFFGGSIGRGTFVQKQAKVLQILNMKRRKIYIHICKKYIAKAARKRSLLHEEVRAHTKRLARICSKHFQEAAIEKMKGDEPHLGFKWDHQRHISEEDTKQKQIVSKNNTRVQLQQEKLSVLALKMKIFAAYASSDNLNTFESEDTMLKRLDLLMEVIPHKDEDEWRVTKFSVSNSVRDAFTLNVSRLEAFDCGVPQFSNLSNEGKGGSSEFSAGSHLCRFIGVLKTFQQHGIDWLVKMFDHGINCILADESGLGKTVQALAFLGHLAEKKFIFGPFLILTQSSEVQNWLDQCTKFVPTLAPTIYAGNFQERKTLRDSWQQQKFLGTQQAPWQILITTCQVFIADMKQLNEIKWQYVILDNGNGSIDVKWKFLLRINCRSRLFLGEPIQSRMRDLWYLLQFVMPSLFEVDEDFSKWSLDNIDSECKWVPTERDLSCLRETLERFVLRRSRREVENELGEKIEILVRCPLTFRQRLLASEIKERIRIEYSRKIISIHHVTQSEMSNLMSAVIQLRKVYNHPDLYEKRYYKSPFYMEQTEYFYPWKMFSTQLCYEIPLEKRRLIENDLCIYNPIYTHDSIFRKHRIASIATDLAAGEVGGSSVWSFTRILGITPVQLYDLIMSGFEVRWNDILSWLAKQDTLNKRSLWDKDEGHKGFRLNDLLLYPETVTSFSNVRSSETLKNLIFVSPSVPVYGFFDQYLSPVGQPSKQIILPLVKTCLPKLLSQVSPKVSTGRQALRVRRKFRKVHRTNRNVDMCTMADNENGHIDFPHHAVDLLNMGLRLPESYCPGASPRGSNRLTDSGKFRALDWILVPLATTTETVVIYTQMSGMLKLLEEYVVSRRWNYIRLDDYSKIFGHDRLENSEREFFIILACSRSTGLRINLAFADTVIFYDSDWNPTFYYQALDRVYCLDRTKKLTVYQLTCDGTIDSKILEATKKKCKRRSDERGNSEDLGPESLKPTELVSLLLEDEELNLKSSVQASQIQLHDSLDLKSFASKRKIEAGLQSRLFKDKLAKRLKCADFEPCSSIGSSVSIAGSSPATSEPCTGEECDPEIVEDDMNFESSDDDSEWVENIPENVDCVDGASPNSNRSTPTITKWNTGSISDYDEDLGLAVLEKQGVRRGVGRRGRPRRVRKISREDVGCRRGRPPGRPRLKRVGPVNQGVRGRKPGRPPTKKRESPLTLT